MEAWFAYFFGAGTEQEFSLFTPAHFAPILWLIAMILLIYRFREPLKGWKHEVAIRYVLDILPPNFGLRITIMGAVITALYFVAYLPWYLKDRKAKKAAA